MYAYMNVKHVNHSTTLHTNFTAYKTIASLPCTVSGPGMGCYFRFHHSGTRRSNNPNLLMIGKSITYIKILNKLRHCNIDKCIYVCMYVCMYVCKFIYV